MTSVSTRATGLSLSELYLECKVSFVNLVLALSEEKCKVIFLRQIDLPEILDQYGRTKIWGDQTKADLPATARGSLDDTLRHDNELRSLVQAILVRLRGLLGQGK